MPETIYTVTQLNNRIKNRFQGDEFFHNLTVKGEVSAPKTYPSKYVYFTLKDENARVSCVISRYNRKGLSFDLKEGDKIEVMGDADLYVPNGTYQLDVKTVRREGLGALYEKYLALEAKLREEGLFDPMYKRPIPPYIHRLGVITSPKGEAVNDIIRNAKRRNPYIQIVLYPALVQGDAAPASLIRGLREMEHHDVDVIIIGRGGGSLEDLWCFNDEALARAIFDCPIPVISAVGHEGNNSISDFVADRRVSTPTAAAELAAFEYAVFENTLDSFRNELYNLVLRRLQNQRKALQDLKKDLKYQGPESRISQMHQRLDACTEQLQNRMQTAVLRTRKKLDKRELLYAMQERLSAEKNKLRLYCERLSGLSPLNRIKNGYGYLTNENGKRISSADDVEINQAIHIYLSDGRIDARAEAIKKEIFKTEGTTTNG